MVKLLFGTIILSPHQLGTVCSLKIWGWDVSKGVKSWQKLGQVGSGWDWVEMGQTIRKIWDRSDRIFQPVLKYGLDYYGPSRISLHFCLDFYRSKRVRKNQVNPLFPNLAWKDQIELKCCSVKIITAVVRERIPSLISFWGPFKPRRV